MPRIEILFSDAADLYGDMFNMKYLERCMPGAEFIYTRCADEPIFPHSDVDMIFIGPMPEYVQELAARKLVPYKGRIEELIDRGVVFLATGNAMELFGEYILDEDGTKTDCLGIFGVHAERRMMKRYHAIFFGTLCESKSSEQPESERNAGTCEPMKIVGFKSQFSHMYGDNSDFYTFDVIKGIGLNPESDKEGLRKNNFIGTNVIGPIMIMNPDFTKYIMKLLGVEDPVLAFEETAYECYQIRLAEFERIEAMNANEI